MNSPRSVFVSPLHELQMERFIEENEEIEILKQNNTEQILKIISKVFTLVKMTLEKFRKHLVGKESSCVKVFNHCYGCCWKSDNSSCRDLYNRKFSLITKNPKISTNLISCCKSDYFKGNRHRFQNG